MQTLNNSSCRGLSAHRGNCTGQRGLLKRKPKWRGVEQGLLGRPRRGGVISALRPKEWIGTSPGKRRNRACRQKKGMLRGPGARESLTSVNATWLTLRMRGKLPGEAREELGLVSHKQNFKFIQRNDKMTLKDFSAGSNKIRCVF